MGWSGERMPAKTYPTLVGTAAAQKRPVVRGRVADWDGVEEVLAKGFRQCSVKPKETAVLLADCPTAGDKCREQMVSFHSRAVVVGFGLGSGGSNGTRAMPVLHSDAWAQAELLFEKFEVPAYFVCSQPVLAMCTQAPRPRPHGTRPPRLALVTLPGALRGSWWTLGAAQPLGLRCACRT